MIQCDVMLPEYHFSPALQVLFCSTTENNSRVFRTILVPLLDQMTDGVPRRAMSLLVPITRDLVSMNETISKCIALVVIQVKQLKKETPLLLRTSPI